MHQQGRDVDRGQETPCVVFVIVVFGVAEFANIPFLTPETLDGANGFVLENFEGYNRSPAGDVNGDGFADLLVGSHIGRLASFHK